MRYSGMRAVYPHTQSRQISGSRRIDPSETKKRIGSRFANNPQWSERLAKLIPSRSAPFALLYRGSSVLPRLKNSSQWTDALRFLGPEMDRLSGGARKAAVSGIMNGSGGSRSPRTASAVIREDLRISRRNGCRPTSFDAPQRSTIARV